MIIVTIRLIIKQVAIGKKKEKLSDLYMKSPGRRPKGNFFKYG